MTKRTKLRSLTDREEAEIQKQIAALPEDEDATDEQVAQAKPFAEAFPALMESIRRARGRPRVESPKQAVTLRLAPGTLDKFKSAGKDWRSLMAKVLDKAKV
jgi:uncharacterized protein (DUF4415 family)